MAETTNLPKLTYFAFGGKGQVCRWALKLSNIEFRDNQVSIEWFKDEIKPKSPSGFLPMFEFNGHTYTDTLAILKLIVAQTGYLQPTSNMDDVLAVSIFCKADELWEQHAMITTRDAPPDEAKEKSLNLEVVLEVLRNLDFQIAQSQDNEGHIVSNKLTYVDLFVAATIRQLLMMCRVPDLDSVAPRCIQVYKMVLSIPIIKAFEYEFEFRNPILSYFNVAARGEGIRLCMAIGGVNFENKTFDLDEWKDVMEKSTRSFTPTGMLPMLEFSGKFHVVETYALLCWVGERTGLLPVTWEGRQKADQIFWQFQPSTYFWRQIRKAADPTAARNEVVGNLIPTHLSKIENQVSDSSAWIAGCSMSWIDVYAASQWKVLAEREFITSSKDAVRYPKLFKIYQKVYSLPAVVKFLEKEICT